MLDELDRELERRKHCFVRYADDCNIYVRSRTAGERVKRSITCFITRRLKLKVNEQKSAVARPAERKFLGFSISNAREPKRRIAAKAMMRFRRKVRELTSRTRGISVERMTKELADYLRGWKGYFGFCETPSVFKELDQWIRRRLRSMIWKQWKRGRVRFNKLCERGVGKHLAAQTAGNPPNRRMRTRMSGGVAGESGRLLPLCRLRCVVCTSEEPAANLQCQAKRKRPGAERFFPYIGLQRGALRVIGSNEVAGEQRLLRLRSTEQRRADCRGRRFRF